MKTHRLCCLLTTICLLNLRGRAAEPAAVETTTTVSQPAVIGTPGAPPDPTRWEREAQEQKARVEGITWLTHEPIQFMLRRGDHPEDEPERYARMCDPDNIKHMADAGVKYGMIYFYKGFGLEYERANMEQAKRTADLMHKYGMKVGVYIGGTMFTETLYHEEPEARNWEQRNQNNHWIPYGEQTFRHYACPNEPAYRDYLKRVLKIAVQEAHVDQILFDNVMLQAEPDSCRCPRCIKAFHDYLRRKYPTKEAVMRRFGLPNVDWIVVNEWDSPTQPGGLTQLSDPVLQEWVRFRCESLANYANDLSDYVKHLNPKVSVYFNIKGVFSYNRYWVNAVYHPLFAGHVDLIAFDTTGYDTRLDANTGALVSQIRSYKMARQLGASCNAPLGVDLMAAQAMAFGYETSVPGYPGTPWMSWNTATPIMQFYRHYLDRYYKGTTNVADVAVLHNWPSMAYSINATYVPTTLMEQVLIQYKVPFDLLFDEQLNHLERYGAIILAGQECVSGTQAKMLLDYVRNGGTLVISGNTGDYNEWREKREVNPFLPARQEGKGRIVYIPSIIPALKAERVRGGNQDAEPGATTTATGRMTPPQWVLPTNHQEIYQSIVDGLPNGLSLTSEAPLTTVAELVTRPATHETIAHFVNFDKKTPLAPFKATVRDQFAGKIKGVTCYTPDASAPIPLTYDESDNHVTFTVPATRVYSMIVIEQD